MLALLGHGRCATPVAPFTREMSILNTATIPLSLFTSLPPAPAQQSEVDDSVDFHVPARDLFDQPKLGLDRTLFANSSGLIDLIERA